MYSIKTKLCSLGLAVGMVLALAGCHLSTPSSVGSIGGVDIPAGVYLLAQYNAYNTASGLADLATGETANDVKAVLKADCTGTIGDEEVTATGEEYIEKLTLRTLEYYAAIEAKFDELGGTLDDTATAEAASSADSLWDSNGDLYEANGIGKSSLEAYLLSSKKAESILNMLYGPDGSDPVSEDEYTDYINNECYFIEGVQLPLLDYSTYSFATDDQKTEIEALAESCRSDLSATATAETASVSELYSAAMTYVPQAMTALGSSMDDSTQALYYAFSQLYTPSDLTSYASGDTNALTDPLDEAGMNQWVTIDLGTTLLVVRRIDPLQSYALDDLESNYSLLTSMKSDDLQTQLYAEGAAMEHNLSSSAMNTYSAGKIKRTV